MGGTGPDNIWAAGYYYDRAGAGTPVIAHFSCG
jgi:hypothetical protein